MQAGWALDVPGAEVVAGVEMAPEGRLQKDPVARPEVAQQEAPGLGELGQEAWMDPWRSPAELVVLERSCRAVVVAADPVVVGAESRWGQSSGSPCPLVSLESHIGTLSHLHL